MTVPRQQATPHGDGTAKGKVCDVLVIGSGAAGLSAAIVAKRRGLDVIVLEKAPYMGGTTAFSGGFLWIPNNPYMHALGIPDSVERARTYLRSELGNKYIASKVDAFLKHGPEMISYFEKDTTVKFDPAAKFPDYHPDVDGGIEGGRALVARPFDATRLGPHLKRLRPPLKAITFVGMMFNSGVEVQHFFNVTRSVNSAAYVVKRMLAHGWELIRYGRGIRLTAGNALAARLAKSAIDLNIPIHTATPALSLVMEGGRVCGADIDVLGSIEARMGVIVATGGFSFDRDRRRPVFKHEARGHEHHSLGPKEVSGDGARFASSAGAAIESLPNAAAWIPVSRIPTASGEVMTFPHLIDRYKPGIIGVGSDGRRFVNEANSYHDFGQAMIELGAQREETAAWLMCDHSTLRRYGLGHVKPFPMPISGYLRSGYLIKGRTIAQLAERAGIDPGGLLATVERFNDFAATGVDLDFGRGSTAYNRYFGDATRGPNPNLGAIEKPPFYAIRLYVGDLSTFDGVSTDARGRALDHKGGVVPGLYVVGADAASVMGGTYPGPGINLGPAMTFGYIAGNDVGSDDVTLARTSAENGDVA